MPRIEYFFGPTGFDFSIGPKGSFRTWFAVWCAWRVDCGIAVGNKEWRHCFRNTPLGEG